MRRPLELVICLGASEVFLQWRGEPHVVVVAACGLCHLPSNFIGVTNFQDCSLSREGQGRNEHVPWTDGSTEGNEEEGEEGEDEGHEGVHRKSSFLLGTIA